MSFTYWARQILEIPGMANRSAVQGHDADVSPARLLFAEKTDCTTGASGVNYYTLYNQAAVAPIAGGDLHKGPFFTKFEGTAEVSRDVENDRYPTAIIKTTHFIAGQSNIVSVRAAPMGMLLVGLNQTENIPLANFDSIVNLTRDVSGGGKIGLKIEFAIVFHNNEGDRNTFIRKAQAGEAISGATAPVANLSYKLSLANPAVSFLQWGNVAAARQSPNNANAPRAVFGGSDWHELAGRVVERLRERATTLKRVDGGKDESGAGERARQQANKPAAWVVPGDMVATGGGGTRAIGETTQMVRQEIGIVLEDTDEGGDFVTITRLQEQRDDVIAALFGWTPDSAKWSPFLFEEAGLFNSDQSEGVVSFLVKMSSERVLRRVV